MNHLSFPPQLTFIIGALCLYLSLRFFLGVFTLLTGIIRIRFPKKKPARTVVPYQPPQAIPKQAPSAPPRKKTVRQKSALPTLLQPIPKSMWGVNVRSRFPKEWEGISREVRQKAKQQCVNCQQRLPMELLDAHEVWHYKPVDGVMTQVLTNIVCLCKRCHILAHPTRYHMTYQNDDRKMDTIKKHWSDYGRDKARSWTAYIEMHQTANSKIEKEAWTRFHDLPQFMKYPLEVERNFTKHVVPFRMDLCYLNQHFRHHLQQDAMPDEMPNMNWSHVKSFATAT